MNYWGRQGGREIGKYWALASKCPSQEGVMMGVSGRNVRTRPPLTPVHIVVERVVASESDQRPQAQPVGEKDLGGCVEPHLWAEDQNLRTDEVQNHHRSSPTQESSGRQCALDPRRPSGVGMGGRRSPPNPITCGNWA